MTDSNLLFIISQPRSGSTLLQSILSNNSQVATASEPWLLLPYLSMMKPQIVKARYDYSLAMVGTRAYADKVLGAGVYEQKMREFLLSMYKPLMTSGINYVLDKTPRYYEICDTIIKCFPNAKVIVVKRNPLAVLNSIIHTWKSDSIHKLAYYQHDLLLAPSLLHQFLKNNRDNNKVKEVAYEDMVANPVETAKGLYEWLDIPFSNDMLNYSGNKKFVGTMGDQVGIKKFHVPVSTSRESWKEIIKVKFWDYFFSGYANYLGAEFLKEYGQYEPHRVDKSYEFKYFKMVCDLKWNRKYSYRQFAKSSIRYLFYYLKFGPPKKLIRLN